jgi:hypothetical protein
MLPPFRQKHHMPEANARPELSLIPILRLRCSTCQGRMMLTCIEPGCDGPDLRIFECSKCEQVYNVPPEDPMKSVKVVNP